MQESKPQKMPSLNNGGLGHPGQKNLRFSDMMFPDPMFYPGYYPQAYQPPHQCCQKDNSLEKYLTKQLLKKLNKREEPIVIDKLGAIKKLIKTVDDVNAKRDRGTPGNRLKNDYYNEVYKNESMYKSPLKSDSMYKNYFNTDRQINSDGNSYQEYKRRSAKNKNDRFGKYDIEDLILPSEEF